MAPKICHAVFFSLDPEKMAANLPGNAVEENLQRLRDTVPGLLEVNMGRAETALFPGYVACCGDYTHCLVSKHVDAAAFQACSTHPSQVAFAELLKASFAKPPIRIDFELKSDAHARLSTTLVAIPFCSLTPFLFLFFLLCSSWALLLLILLLLLPLPLLL
ncbi:putative Stress responsive A B Barrel Domain [Trypanosoma vivax]|nr:putative Stress responsive A B Barrel Domain [Trypanosoma vivax]